MSISALSAVTKLINHLYLFMLLFGFCSLLVMLSILCCCALCFSTSTSLLNNLPVNPGLLRHSTVYWQGFASCCPFWQVRLCPVAHVQGRLHNLQCKMPTLRGQWCRWLLLSRTGCATHVWKSSSVYPLHCTACCASDASGVVLLMHISL